RDLALEREQLGARGAFDGAPRRRDRAGRLEEVRRMGRATSTLLGARGVAEVDGHDLAGSARQHPETAIARAVPGDLLRRCGHEFLSALFCIRNRIRYL